MSRWLKACAEFSYLAPGAASRVADALQDVYAVPARIRSAIGVAMIQTTIALREHDPETKARREWAMRVAASVFAPGADEEARRRREAN